MLSTFDVGEGPRRVLLLHGFLGSGRNLLSLARAWVERDPGISLRLADLTGHGASPALPPGAGMNDLALDVLEAGGPGPLDIAGHSLGGRVALAAAGLEPARVRRLALLDIAPGPITDPALDSDRVLQALLDAPAEAESRAAMRKEILEHGLSPSLTEWVLTNLVPRGDVYGWRFDRAALAALHDPVNGADLWPVVERGGLELLCVRGSQSGYVSDADAARLERAGCPVITLDTGHFLHVEKPGPLLDALVPFFKETRTPGA